MSWVGAFDGSLVGLDNSCCHEWTRRFHWTMNGPGAFLCWSFPLVMSGTGAFLESWAGVELFLGHDWPEAFIESWVGRSLHWVMNGPGDLIESWVGVEISLGNEWTLCFPWVIRRSNHTYLGMTWRTSLRTCWHLANLIGKIQSGDRGYIPGSSLCIIWSRKNQTFDPWLWWSRLMMSHDRLRISACTWWCFCKDINVISYLYKPYFNRSGSTRSAIRIRVWIISNGFPVGFVFLLLLQVCVFYYYIIPRC